MDVSWRAQPASSKVKRRQRAAAANAGGTIGVLSFVVTISALDEGYGPLLAFAISVLLGFAGSAFFRRYYERKAKQLAHGYCLKHFGGVTAVRCDIEARASGLWARQGTTEVLLPWSELELVVVVANYVPRSLAERCRIPELLRNPRGARVAGHAHAETIIRILRCRRHRLGRCEARRVPARAGR